MTVCNPAKNVFPEQSFTGHSILYTAYYNIVILCNKLLHCSIVTYRALDLKPINPREMKLIQMRENLKTQQYMLFWDADFVFINFGEF